MMNLGILLLAVISCATQEQAVEATGTDIVQLSSRGPLQVGEPRVNSEVIGLYEKFEVTFDLSGEWGNPFDPDQIKVDARFIAPDGEELTIPGFFHQEYRLDEDGNHVKVDDPVWKVRFAPSKTGQYSWQVTVNNQGEERTTSSQSFTSRSYNSSNGFLRISETNPLYFEYDDGTPFYGVAKGRQQGNSYNKKHYTRFAEAGGNFNRLFLTNGALNLGEMLPSTPRPDRGAGKMNLEGSWNLDRVLEAGEKLGIYHILSLTNQWTFNNRWEVHAYNRANGGPLDRPAEYWTNEEAQQYFENHLRYAVARWGYSPSVFAWDLWNEYTAMQGSDMSVAIPWHERMARHIASLDPFDHVIQTNDGSLNGREEMNALPEMEFISTNIYMIRNMAKVAEDWTKFYTGKFVKPFVLSEFGTGHGVGGAGGYAGMDPERRMVHNALWSPIVSGGASTGLAWEGNWLDHEIFYTYTRAVSQFVDGIPFSKREWSTVNVASFRFVDSRASNPVYGGAIVDGWSGNFRISGNNAAEQDIFHIDSNGNVDPQEYLSAVLVSPLEEDLSWVIAPNGLVPSVTFQMDYPADGEFVVYVPELRSTEPTPQITVTIDGDEVLREDLLPLDVENYHPRMHNEYFTIPVSAGEHTIRVENTGGGSMVTSFELKNYVPREPGPDLEVRGLQTDDHILLWFKNYKFTLLHSMMDVNWKPQAEGVLELQDVPDGRWVAEWINTIDATTVKREVIESSDKRLELNTPVVEESVAVRLHRM